MKELIRPWKLVTFGIGMAFLYWGALTQGIPDWDTGDSTLMGLSTYLTAPLGARWIMKGEWLLIPVGLFFWWFTVDGLYVAWNGLAGNQIYREANFYASTALYWLCGFIWLPRGNLKELFSNPRSVLM